MKKPKSVSRPNVSNSRKIIRKEKRQQKKKNRKEHYSKKKTNFEQPKITVGKFVKRPPDDPVIGAVVKKKKPQPATSSQDIIIKEREKDKNAAEKLKSQMEEQRKNILLQANEEEDKLLKKLEKQLGLKKSKNKTKHFADDGLDYLLEICDRSTTEQIVAAEKHLANIGDSDFEEDLAAVTGKEVSSKKKVKTKKDTNLSEDTEISDSDEDDNSKSENELSAEEDLSGGNTTDEEQDEISEVDNNSDDGSDSSVDDPEELPMKSHKSSKAKQNVETKNSEKSLKSTKISSKNEKIISEDDLSKVFSDDEVSHLSDDSDHDQLSGDDMDVDKINEQKEEKPDVWEDIYGRKRDKEGNIIKEEKGIYIPPHLRNKDSISDKQLVQLERQINSVLNKVSGAALPWASGALEAQYGAHSRHAVSAALARRWVAAALTPSAAAPRLLADLAALVAVLHANVANEIGAFFLQDLTKRFDQMMESPQPVEDKTLDNLVSCLAHLYSFKLFHATLLYDILARLLDKLSEKTIDCILAILRTVGGVLRKEEPLALKNFIHETQARVAKLNDTAESGSRIKFLLEVLMAVKNNNLNKIPNYDPSYTEDLKKVIKTIIRKGNYITPLNIRLEDLLKADERGKWWIVGSAWEGHTPPEPRAPPPADRALLELARQQRMNTDVRRSIFCVIMSAEDYMDAYEKLQRLGLRGGQRREVPHVVLACALRERRYNPYYAVLAQKLCDVDRKHQLSIQFAVWDKIKELKSLSRQELTNLAQLLIHLFMEKGLPLSVLKIIQFSELDKHTVRFMRQILLAIMMNADLQTSLEVFHRISKPPKLHMFRESLKLFIQHFLLKNATKKSSVLSEDEMATLKERATEVNKILSLYESKLRL